LLSCEYAKWFLIIHSNKTQLWSHIMVFFYLFFVVVVVFFFLFSRCMVTFLWNSLNFQNLFVWTNTNMISVSYQNFEFPKKLYEHVRSCIVLEGKKGNTLVVSWVKVVLSVLFAWNDNKNKGTLWTQENTWSYLTRKTHFTEKVLWYYELNYQQDWTKLKLTWSNKRQ
jgi:hypothetical protein